MLEVQTYGEFLQCMPRPGTQVRFVTIQGTAKSAPKK